MKLKPNLTALLSVIVLTATAQNHLFIEAFGEFTSSGFRDHQTIEIDWKMKGAVQADFNEGLNNLEENPAIAELNFTEALKKDSMVWQAYYYRAVTRKMLDNLTGAQKDLLKSIKIKGDFYEGWIELARVRHLLGSGEAESSINKAIKIDKWRAPAYFVKGQIHLLQNRLKEAINSFNNCLRADSLYHNARVSLALASLGKKEGLPEGMSQLNKVLLYDSLHRHALLFRSFFNAETDMAQSIKDLTNLISVSPNNVMAYYFRGLFSAYKEDYEQAFSDFHRIIKMTSTSDNNFRGQQSMLDKKIDLQNVGAYTVTRVFGLDNDEATHIKQAYCHIITQEYDKAIQSVGKMKKQNSEPLAVYLKAVAHEHKGLHTQALELYSLALQLDSDIEDAYKKRGIYYQELQMWDKSIEDLTNVLRLNPDGFVINRIRAVSYYYNNELEKSITDYNTFLKYDSSNREVIGQRGMAYLKMDQRLKAYMDFAVSRNFHMLNYSDIEKLIDDQLASGDTTAALRALNTLTQHQPGFTAGFIKIFQIHMARNNWKAVEDQIDIALRYSRNDVQKSRYSQLLTIQAIMYSRRQREKDAMRFFNEAISADKRNGFAYFERGRMLVALGKNDQGEKDIKKASSLGYHGELRH